MNPQYVLPQQQFGAPPLQTYNQNKPPPSSTPQGAFQNVPLGPQTGGMPVPNNLNPQLLPGQQAHIPRQNQAGSPFEYSQQQQPLRDNFNAPPLPSNYAPQQPRTNQGAPIPPQSVPQMPLNAGPPQNIGPAAPPPKQQIPPGQLPPSQVARMPGMLQETSHEKPDLQNQHPPQDLPPNVMNGAGFGPPPSILQSGQLPSMQNKPASGLNQPFVNGSTSQYPPGSGNKPPVQVQPPLPNQNQDNQFHQQQQPPLQNRPPLGPAGFDPPNINGPATQYLGSAGMKSPMPSMQNQHLGQPPLPGQQSGQPPLPGQQYRQPPAPGQPSQFSQQPPGQYNSNQLSNQMQGMSLSGPRQYPGMPQKQINGENGPHMPPSLSGQGAFLNGQQQMRTGPPAQPGYPPMPGQPQMPSGPGAYPQPGYQAPGYQQAQQNRRLDPDQMPNPIQVTQDDQRTRSGIFVTNQKGLVPPLVSTNFIVQDQGNASPRYIRSTMYNVPISQDLMKQTAVPFGLVISPMARTVGEEYPPPIVNFGDLGPVRCIRCKAYMCPYMQFIDSGRRFQCLFCKAATEVSTEYFQHLDHTGQRVDRFERPELILGTYELTATPDYCRNNVLPKPPAIIFVIDVSYNNIKSGLVNLLCMNMKDIIQNLPIDQGYEKSNMKVGFITYNSSVHFYNIKGTLAAPQMLVVGDTHDMFMPLLDGFLCTPEESSQVIDLLMEQIPAMFGDTRETETVLLPAILAGLEALKASECAGKLLVFHSSLPIADAPGKLKNRDDRKLLGTDKERTVLTPQTQAYNQLGQDCVQVGCSVDLFLFNNAYIDVATIGQVSRLSGGEVYKYTYFQADLDGERLITDIITDISRPIAFDAIMRVRTSTGVRPTDFYGHFFMSNTTDMEMGSIDCDKAVAVEVKHDDKLSEEEGVYIQVALLYTSCSGQRRLRIINLALKTCSQMSDLYRSCDLDTMINFFAKQSVYRLLENNPKVVKDAVVNRAAQILANYRKNCASPSSAGQLILPECMKLLPLYVNCLLKSDALSGGSDMTLDDRSFVMQAVMTMDIPTSVIYFYPHLIPLHDLKLSNSESAEIPQTIRCTIEKMTDHGIYILENGVHMFLWIGLNASPEFLQQVFGVPSAMQVNLEQVKLPVLDNPLSAAVRSIIDQITAQKHRRMKLTLVRQREKLEPVFKHFLVEDRGQDNSPSYVDFLCHMHKEIRTLLS